MFHYRKNWNNKINIYETNSRWHYHIEIFLAGIFKNAIIILIVILLLAWYGLVYSEMLSNTI